MPVQAYRAKQISTDRLARIEQAAAILAEYDTKLTARQLYYQFVARDLIPNTPRSYQNITALITDARYAGLIDWDAIEDRGREPSLPLEFQDLDHRIESALQNYRLPRWADQDCYAELWVEKQALAGVLAPLAREFHVTLMVNKGYSSASAMYESAQRMREAQGCTDDFWNDWEARCEAEIDEVGGQKGDPEYDATMAKYVEEFKTKVKPVVLFYLGDHDPSGEDMVRDIEDRLKEFKVRRLEVEKLALTMEQIKKFKPPPNPAKLTDSRASAYIEKFGTSSWEVDALPPRELQRIIRAAFESVIDRGKMAAVMKREESDKARLREALKDLT